MTPRERRLYLRWLRFPRTLEREFDQDHSRRFVGHVRTLLGLALFFILIVGGAGNLVTRAEPLPALALYDYGFLFPATLALFLFTWRPAFPRFLQPCMFFVFLAFGGHGLLKRALLPAGAGTALAEFDAGMEFVELLLLVLFPLSQLRFRRAALASWLLIAGYALAGLAASQGKHLVPLTVMGTLLQVNLIGMCIGYLSERNHRENFLLRREVEQERHQSERLLLNVLPVSIAERLKHDAVRVADSHADVTVLFADIVDFTRISARLSAEEVVGLLNEVFSGFDRLAERYGLEKIKTIGDAYLVAGGLPAPQADHARAIAEMALDMRDQMAALSAARPNDEPLHLRIGINTGPVVAGVIGTKKFIYDLWGATVNLASRLESHGVADGIQVGQATYDRLHAHYVFADPRQVLLKGHGPTTVYLLLSRHSFPLPGSGGPPHADG